MKTPTTDKLRAEVERYQLRFSCEDCAYFCPIENRCAEGYPHEMHLRKSLFEEELLFCKLFELGSNSDSP